MRGQVFTIEGKTYFTMGGASSHDVQGGILDKDSPTYHEDFKKAVRRGEPFRILNVSWWKEELLSEEQLQEALINLEKYDFKVDYVISHCSSNRTQDALEHYYLGIDCEIHYVCVNDETWKQNIFERNKRVQDGEGGSDFYLDEGLMKTL